MRINLNIDPDLTIFTTDIKCVLKETFYHCSDNGLQANCIEEEWDRLTDFIINLCDFYENKYLYKSARYIDI